MKTRALVRRKAKKRRFCNANRRPKESNDERETAVRPVRPRPFSDNSIVNQQQSLAVAHGQMATSPSTSTPKVSVKEVRNRSFGHFCHTVTHGQRRWYEFGRTAQELPKR